MLVRNYWSNCEHRNIKVYFCKPSNLAAIFETLSAIFKHNSLATLELHLSAVFVWSGSTKFVLDRDCCSNLTLVAISREGEVAGFSRSVIIFFWNNKKKKIIVKFWPQKTWKFELELFYKTRSKISSFLLASSNKVFLSCEFWPTPILQYYLPFPWSNF